MRVAGRFVFIFLIMAGLGFFLWPGCGYRFTGTGSFPEGVSTVHITMFENRTGHTGAENIISNSLMNEFSQRSGVHLAKKETAEAVLSGTVKSITTHTVSHFDEYTSAERRLVLVLSVELIRAGDGEVVWSDDHIRESEVYAMASESHTTRQQRDAELAKVAEDIAERVYNRLTSRF